MPAPEAGEPATDAVLDLGVADALAARRSCRSFLERPLEQGLLADLIDRARRTPSAGNAQGVDFLLLEGPADTAAYWETTLPEEGRATFPWPGLLAAPALVVVYADADRYVERYAEADKAASGLGGDAGDWPVPYWYVDAAFAALALQLLVVGKGLGCCFFGLFEHERAVAERFGVPSGRRAVGVVAVGHPATAGQRPSGSTTRGRRDLGEVLHRGHWGAADERPTGAAG